MGEAAEDELDRATTYDDFDRSPRREDGNGRCPHCGGQMTWCSHCMVWSRTCCIDYGTCQCS